VLRVGLRQEMEKRTAEAQSSRRNEEEREFLRKCLKLKEFFKFQIGLVRDLVGMVTI
jgi:hypothetical protein